MTVFGRVKLKRHRVKCHECTSLSQPVDSMLKEVRGGHASIRFAELASLSGRRYAATFGSSERAGRLIYAQARRQGIDHAVKQSVKLSHRYPTDSLRELMTYVSNNADWIGDYDWLRSEGYPVGSGAVEKAVDIVINRRLKGRRGMRWKRACADEVAALRVLTLNNDWNSMRLTNNTAA